MRSGLPIMKNVLTILTRNVLLPLVVTAAAWTTDVSIQQKIYGSGMTAMTISNEEMKDIMKIAKCLEEFGLLIKVLSGTLAASL